MTAHLLWIALSLALLFFGAEWLVRGSSGLALRLGLTPLVIGLTVVAYGTSMPELVVSTRAALDGAGDIAVGNVVGSNIFNIGIILGLSALVLPLRVKMQLLRLDAPIMIGVSVLLLFVLADARVSRWEAALFVAGILVYTVFNLRLARRERSEEVRAEFADAVADAPRGKLWLDLVLIAGGLAVLVIGSRLLVSNSIGLARLIGISEAVIGLTIVAAGTSMPELATSIIAAWRREPDIALGNVIGSNIYNILAILGVSGLLAPLHAPGIRTLDLWVMLAMAVVLLPLIWTRLAVARWEGALLVAGYCAYVYVLWPH
jgi:cation:H+ antiporter